ncbi:hypothetical protein BH09PAT2_BH09PAT2_03330 [soil metagenome]
MIYQSSFTNKLEQELQEIFSIKPNDLGNQHLTMVYKYITGPLKKMPFVYVIPMSFVVSFMLYALLGQFVVKLVSLLQYGF